KGVGGPGVVHRARPRQVEVTQRIALRIADRDERRPGEVAVERGLEVEVLAAVQRVDGGCPDQVAEGEGEIIYVTVNHVEVAGAVEDHGELAEQIGRAQL